MQDPQIPRRGVVADLAQDPPDNAGHSSGPACRDRGHRTAPTYAEVEIPPGPSANTEMRLKAWMMSRPAPPPPHGYQESQRRSYPGRQFLSHAGGCGVLIRVKKFALVPGLRGVLSGLWAAAKMVDPEGQAGRSGRDGQERQRDLVETVAAVTRSGRQGKGVWKTQRMSAESGPGFPSNGSGKAS
jgi:hypothetical protein